MDSTGVNRIGPDTKIAASLSTDRDSVLGPDWSPVRIPTSDRDGFDSRRVHHFRAAPKGRLAYLVAPDSLAPKTYNFVSPPQQALSALQMACWRYAVRAVNKKLKSILLGSNRFQMASNGTREGKRGNPGHPAGSRKITFQVQANVWEHNARKTPHTLGVGSSEHCV